MGLLDHLKGSYVRRKYSRLHDLPHGDHSVRLARSIEDLSAAFRLIHVGYAYLGIEGVEANPYRMTDQHILPESHVLCAMSDGMLVGTITLTLDSPAGLPLDHDYDAVEALRSPTRRLAEIGSFVVVKRCWNNGVAQFLAACAARLAFAFHNVTDLVIGVHPKTIPFYAAVWGFDRLAAPKQHASLAAPVVGLHVTREQVRAHLTKYCKPSSTGTAVVDHVMNPQTPLPSTQLAEAQLLGGKEPSRVTREVFQHLFIERTAHLSNISDRTREYLETLRSESTLHQLDFDNPTISELIQPNTLRREDDTIPIRVEDFE